MRRAIEPGAARPAAAALAGRRSASDGPRRFGPAFTRARGERHAADHRPFLQLRREQVGAALEAGHAALDGRERLGRGERQELVTRCLFRDRP